MKRVIVTGANGFVGSNIVTVLQQQGDFVYALDLEFDNPAAANWNRDGVEFIQASCADLPALEVDALIHAAFITAAPGSRNESPEANLRANIDPLLRVMEYTEAQGIKRSVFISSTAVYQHTPTTTIDETRPADPLGVYAVAKTLMEHTVESMRTVYGRDYVCARLGSVYGSFEFPRQTRPRLSLIGLMMHDALNKGEIVVSQPMELRQWTLASDIGRAIVALLNTASLNYTLYHIASGERKTNLEIAQMIDNLLDGVSLRIGSVMETGRPITRNLGWLDNSRLRRDTGFCDWTPMSPSLFETMLAGLGGGGVDA